MIATLADPDARRSLIGQMLAHDLDPKRTTLPELVAWLTFLEEQADDQDDGRHVNTQNTPHASESQPRREPLPYPRNHKDPANTRHSNTQDPAPR